MISAYDSVFLLYLHFFILSPTDTCVQPGRADMTWICLTFYQHFSFFLTITLLLFPGRPLTVPPVSAPGSWDSPALAVFPPLLSPLACARVRGPSHGAVKINLIYNDTRYKHVRKQRHGDSAQTKSQCRTVFIRPAWRAERAQYRACGWVDKQMLISCNFILKTLTDEGLLVARSRRVFFLEVQKCTKRINTSINLPHQSVLIFVMSCRVSVWVCLFFHSLYTEGSATLVYKHIVNLSPACARVCTCLRVSGPTALHLALTLKRCQQVCDETSQTIPHLPLFHSGPSWLARPSDTLCSHLVLSPLRIFSHYLHVHTFLCYISII